jgi:hypothetical protein
MDRRYLFSGKQGLGDFDPVSGLFSLGSSLIQTGGVVGSAYIASDAVKYAVKQNDATQVSIAQIQSQAQQNLTATQTAGQTQQLQTVASTLTSWPVLLFGVSLALIMAGGGRESDAP